MQIQIDLPHDALLARVLAYLKRLKIPYTIGESPKRRGHRSLGGQRYVSSYASG